MRKPTQSTQSPQFADSNTALNRPRLVLPRIAFQEGIAEISYSEIIITHQQRISPDSIQVHSITSVYQEIFLLQAWNHWISLQLQLILASRN